MKLRPPLPPQQTRGCGVLLERPMSDKAMLGTSNYPRKKNELYLTPDWCTEVLLRHVVFDALTWEPAAADGALANILFKRTPTIATDLEPLDKQVKKHDFLTSPGPLRRKFKNIVTNPPYKLAQKFIEQANDLDGMLGPSTQLVYSKLDGTDP